MRILKIIFICACLPPMAASAQINLVLNPSFEQYSHCPQSADVIKFANYWSSLTDTLLTATDTFSGWYCTPEFCHTCSNDPGLKIPLSTNYWHFPHTGNGMAQVQMYYREDFDTTFLGKRDYLQGRLKNRLTGGKQYNVSFYVTLEQLSGFAIDHIGAYLDNGIIDTAATLCGMPQTTHIPQVYETTIINDTLNWVKVDGIFTADGTERFITIGNFFDAAHTDTVFTDYWNFGRINYLSWYLVDDVSVIDCDNNPHAGNDTAIRQGDTVFLGTHEQLLPYKWYVLGSPVAIDSGSGLSVHPSVTTTYVLAQTLCGVTKYDTVTVKVWKVGVETLTALKEQTYTLQPNPNNGQLTLQQKALDNNPVKVQVLDAMGRVVYSNSTVFTDGKLSIQLPNNIPGLYLLQLSDNSGNSFIREFVVQ
jgi:hypothetical protein